MMDGEQETLASFWIDKDDMSRCEDDLMVTKSLRIKQGKILDSFCKEKYEGYKCWREHKGTWLYRFHNLVHSGIASGPFLGLLSVNFHSLTVPF